MKISYRQTLQVGSYGVNATVLEIAGKAWIVDPGSEGDRIAELLDGRSLVPAGILLTHAHFDHVGAIPELQRRYPGLPVVVGDADKIVLSHPMNCLPPEYPGIGRVEGLLSYGESGSLPEGMEVVETPGHTPGGVCLYFPEDSLLLSGDTLFAGSVGRTDFPGGNMTALMASIEKLKRLPDDTSVIPGHGSFTTIGAEKSGNPFF